MIWAELFWSFFQIGLFSVGGGYAAMPLIEQQIVYLHGWLTPAQFGDIVAIAEMTPGPIAVNAATFVGMQVAGPAGAVIATLGNVFPSCIIVLLLAYLYNRYRGLEGVRAVLNGMQPAVIAMIASAGLTLLTMAIYGENHLPENIFSMDPRAVLLFLGALIALFSGKVKPLHVMLSGAVCGCLLF